MLFLKKNRGAIAKIAPKIFLKHGRCYLNIINSAFLLPPYPESFENEIAPLKTHIPKTKILQFAQKATFFKNEKAMWVFKGTISFSKFSWQVAPNWVKVATDGNILGDKTFFEVSLKNFLLTSWPCWRYLKGPPWLVLYASKKIVTIRYTDRIIWKEKGSILGRSRQIELKLRWSCWPPPEGGWGGVSFFWIYFEVCIVRS